MMARAKTTPRHGARSRCTKTTTGASPETNPEEMLIIGKTRFQCRDLSPPRFGNSGGSRPQPIVPRPESEPRIKAGRGLRALGLTALAGAILILAAACTHSAAPTPTPTPVPTAAPTATPSPSPTAVPTASQTPQPTPTPAAVSLPSDDAAHNVNTEWWYVNGHLETADGARFGFHEAFFKIDVFRQSTGPVGVLAQAGLIDAAKKTFSQGEVTAIGMPSQPAHGFDIAAGGWSMSGYNGHFKLKIAPASSTLTLSLDAEKPPIKYQGTGLVDFGAAGKSYYYSYPLLRATGTLVTDGQSKPVSGQVWFDHQWGNFHQTQIGWDWFSLQFNNDTELMFSYVHDQKGNVVQRYGAFVKPDGTVIRLSAQDVQYQPTGHWTSPRTGITYPMGWRLQVPKLGIDVELHPVIQDAEMVSKFGGAVPTYWEGEVTLSGTSSASAVSGRGYVELLGYGNGASSTSTSP